MNRVMHTDRLAPNDDLDARLRPSHGVQDELGLDPEEIDPDLDDDDDGEKIPA